MAYAQHSLMHGTDATGMARTNAYPRDNSAKPGFVGAYTTVTSFLLVTGFLDWTSIAADRWTSIAAESGYRPTLYSLRSKFWPY